MATRTFCNAIQKCLKLLKAQLSVNAIILFTCLPTFLFSQYIIKGKLYNSETREPLAFGTIYNNEAYAITNEDGDFELKLKAPAKRVKVHYIGFKMDSISIISGQTALDIFLVPEGNLLDEVVIKAKSGDFRYRLFFKATESYFKNGFKDVHSKSYYRTYTLLNQNEPAELFEAFYNQTCNAQEVKNLKLKGGRFLLPRKKTFINFASTTLIEMFKPLAEGQDQFPFSPLQCVTLLHLKNNYNILIKNIFKADDDTLYQFAFTPSDTLNSFTGELFYYKKSNRVAKLKLLAANVTVHPLYSLRDAVQDKISELNYFIEIGYTLHNQKNVISYVNFDMNFNLKTAGKTDFVSTNMKMVNFDYEKSFTLPLYPKLEFKFDYEKVAAFPYNAGLFENNIFIKEASKDLLVRKLFDSVRCYNSITLDESLLFLQKRFQRWSPQWQLDEELVQHSFLPEAHTHYGDNFSKSKKAAWDSSFASTFIFLDYDCYKDSATFKTNALMDYNYSFVVNPGDTLTTSYFKMYLNSCKVKSKEFESYLQKKYKGKCPSTPLQIKEDWLLFDLLNTSAAYEIHSTANSPERVKEYSKFYTEFISRP